DELRRACDRHALPSSDRSRPALATRLLEASGVSDSVPPSGVFGGRDVDRRAPARRDIVEVRKRQYLVEAVVPPPKPRDATRVLLVCLDDDAQGRPLEVLWELELG